MKRWPVRTTILSALSLLLISGLAALQQKPAAATHRAMVDQYCVACHNDNVKTAGLSLETPDLTMVGKDAATWEKVLRKLNAKQMPPEGMPRPSDPELKSFTTYLETELDHYADAHPNPGHPTIHRLNRAEYSNTIRDLFGLDVNVGSNLPRDDSGYGFDNIGDVLSLSPVLIERYISTGRLVSRLAVGNPDVKSRIDTYAAPVCGNRCRSEKQARSPRNAQPERMGDEMPFDSAGGLAFQYLFPVEADYLFRIRMPGPTAGFGEAAPPVAGILEEKVHVKPGMRSVGLTFMRSAAVAEVVPVTGGRGGFAGPGRGAAAPPTAHMDLRLDGSRVKLYDVAEGANGPAIGDFIDLSIDGPHNIVPAADSVSRQKIFLCKPAAAKDEPRCARTILTALARRAYRRPVNEADLKPLLAFYDSGRKDGSFDRGIESAIQAILVAPDFLFRIERDPVSAPGTAHRVSDFELGSRLSYFLWSSMPDEELLKLAEQGKLKDEAVLSRQVSRMLDDPKSKAFLSNFAGQYLYLRNLASQKPDPDEYPVWDGLLRDAFEQETQLFFNAIVRENRPVTELIDAKFTFLNQRLADFYGVRGVYGSQFRRVELTDPNRGGILGQGSLLTVTSYPNRTSVVQRGKWVLENLLGTPPPPPPPNVPPLEERGKASKTTMRQAMEAHRANPVCASCHARMDPIGFALENYDGVGSWRAKEGGAPIDASGKLPDGSAFNGPAGLKQLLLKQHRAEFIETFTDKLMTYALGRGLEPGDQPAQRAVMRDAAAHGDTIPALIEAIVRSPQFQMRRTKE